MEALCRRLHILDGDAGEALGQALLPHVGQSQGAEPPGLEDPRQGAGQRQSAVAAAEGDEGLPREPVLRGRKSSPKNPSVSTR